MKKWTTPYEYYVNNLGLPEGCIQFATYSIKNSINPPAFVVDDIETLDCRDLLLNGDNNGLVVKLPNGNLVRAPYVYPYVCPFLRSSIGDPMDFSIKIWELNFNFHKKLNFKLSDYRHFQPLFVQAGFEPEDSMESICEWHLDLLRGLK